MKKAIIFIAFFALTTSFVGQVLATEEIENLIKEGQNALKEKNYNQAVIALQDAINKINELIVEELKTFLPPAPQGYKIEKSEGQSIPAGLFGGGISVERSYTHSSGKNLRVNISLNAPLVQSIAMLINNPMLMGYQENTKSIKIKNYRGSFKWEEENKQGEISILVSNNLLVQVKGSEIPDKNELQTFAETIDYVGLEKKFGK